MFRADYYGMKLVDFAFINRGGLNMGKVYKGLVLSRDEEYL